jgi:hypothetical protein
MTAAFIDNFMTIRNFCGETPRKQNLEGKMENSRTKTILITVAVAVIALVIALGVLSAGKKAQRKVDAAADWAVGQITEINVAENLTLPTKYEADGKVKLAWTSDNPDIIGGTGVFTAPSQDAAVKLTCKAAYKNKSATREKTVTAKAAQAQSIPYNTDIAPFGSTTNNASGNGAFGNMPHKRRNAGYNPSNNTSDMSSGGYSRYNSGAYGGTGGYSTRYNDADNAGYINNPTDSDAERPIVDRRAYRRKRGVLNNPNVGGAVRQNGTGANAETNAAEIDGNLLTGNAVTHIA